MSSFRICSNCFGYRVYPWMGFMTGERYQCQECEEILVMPLEFDSTEAYLGFLKVQSPDKIALIENELKRPEKAPKAQIITPKNEALNLSLNNEKLSHICIFGSCQKGKRGGTDFCRKHWLEGQDIELGKV